MINTTAMSRASKTNGCAVTYRSGSGSGSCFATCPSTCRLKPSKEPATDKVDHIYLKALLSAVPRAGVAFTYSHFPITTWAAAWKAHRATGKPTTTINYSADSYSDALHAMREGVPVVIMTSHDDQRKTFISENGVRVVKCPATNLGSTLDCAQCGGGSPLCARPDRQYAIAFPAHGPSKKKAGTSENGGCYASGGRVRLHWERLAAKKEQPDDDGAHLTAFVKTLPKRTALRHHVAGDIGLA